MIAIEIASGKTQVHFTLGAVDGVMPGDKGWVATDSGGKLTIGGSTADVVNNGTVLKADVKVSSSEDRSITVTATSPTPLKFTHVRVAPSTCK